MRTSGEREKDKFAVFEEWLLENKAEFSQVRKPAGSEKRFFFHLSVQLFC